MSLTQRRPSLNLDLAHTRTFRTIEPPSTEPTTPEHSLAPLPAATPATAPVLTLADLRVRVASGADISHWPAVSFHPLPGGGRGIIDRTVSWAASGSGLATPPAESVLAAAAAANPNVATTSGIPETTHDLPLFGPDFAAHLVQHLSSAHAPALSSPSSPLPEAWWGGVPSIRAAAWRALSPTTTPSDSPRPGRQIKWRPGGFALSPASSSFIFSPPFSPAEVETLHSLVQTLPDLQAGADTPVSPSERRGSEGYFPRMPRDICAEGAPSSVFMAAEVQGIEVSTAADTSPPGDQASGQVDGPREGETTRSRRNTLSGILGVLTSPMRKGRG